MYISEQVHPTKETYYMTSARILSFQYKVNRGKCKSGASEPMPSISYDTAFEVALSTGFILYYILVRACIAAETLRGHFSSGCVGVWKCVVFPLVQPRVVRGFAVT
jgi:hypothetical protein